MEAPMNSEVQPHDGKGSLIGMSIGLLLIGLIVGYFVGKNGIQPVAYQSTTTPVATVSATWKTYTSNTLGVSFEYPSTPDFVVSDIQAQLPATTNTPLKYSAISVKHTVPVEPECPSGDRERCGYITNNPELRVIIVPQNFETVKASQMKTFPYEEKTIGGHAGIWGDFGAEGYGEWLFLYPTNNGRTILLSSEYTNDEYLKSYTDVPGWIPYAQQQNIFIHLIESLKFINI